MTRAIRVCLVFASLQLGWGGLSWACQCGPSSYLGGVDEYDVVFVGMAQPAGCRGGTRFAVEDDIALDRPQRSVFVSHETSGAVCGMPFGAGERWLVFAQEGQGGLVTDGCAPHLLEPTDAQLDKVHARAGR